MTPHSSTLAWEIPWMEEPGRLQSMGSLRVGHNWVSSLSLSCIGEGNGNPLQCSWLEKPRDGGAWWAAVCGVAQSRTWLKRLSSRSSNAWVSLVPAPIGHSLLRIWLLSNDSYCCEPRALSKSSSSNPWSHSSLPLWLISGLHHCLLFGFSVLLLLLGPIP